jgi:AcrR family transcriptional regulator
MKMNLFSAIFDPAWRKAGLAGGDVAKKNEMELQDGMTAAISIRKGDRTRQVFMDAGRRVFVRDGYLNAEISEIAKEAGKSNGTFYIYFENKSALLDAMVAEFYTVIGKRFPEHDDQWYTASAAEDWALVLQNMWDSFKAHAPMFHALSQASLVDEHFAKAFTEVRNRTRTDFINLLKTRQKQGLCRTLNSEYTATALETMILYSMNEWLAEGGRTLDRRSEKKALSALTGIFSVVMSAG